jgi:hypothetical protein
MVEFAMNNSFSESTHNTPFMLNYGVNPRHPDVAKLVDMHMELHGDGWREHLPERPVQLAAVNLYCAAMRDVPEVPAVSRFTQDMHDTIKHTRILLEAARSRMKQTTDPKRSQTPEFAVGEKVWLSTKHLHIKHGGVNKLFPRFVGPFPVARRINAVAYELTLPDTMKIHPVFHVSLLRKFQARNPDGSEGVTVDPHPPPLVIDGEEEYEVECILQSRESSVRGSKRKHGKHRAKRTEYLVKWVGYGHEHNQWLPESWLGNCQDLLRDFLAKKAQLPRATTRRGRGKRAQAHTAAILWAQLVPWV